MTLNQFQALSENDDALAENEEYKDKFDEDLYHDEDKDYACAVLALQEEMSNRMMSLTNKQK